MFNNRMGNFYTKTEKSDPAQALNIIIQHPQEFLLCKKISK